MYSHRFDYEMPSLGGIRPVTVFDVEPHAEQNPAAELLELYRRMRTGCAVELS
jgi:hypothetical protein